MPFGGRYRLIDFTLSNMVNSGIQSIAIFPKFNYRSLMDHLGTGKDWGLNRKRDGLFFLPPPFYCENGDSDCSFHFLKYHLDYFYRSSQEYVVFSNSNNICSINFQDVLQQHLETNADITEVRSQETPLDMYVLKKSLLLDLIHSQDPYKHTSVWDVIKDYRYRIDIQPYEFTGYVAKIDSVASYYKHSLDLLLPNVWNELFFQSKPIYTKIKDEPPTRYKKHAEVNNSKIANGCSIGGYVENSIIFRGVQIEEGAVVKNSIVMQKGKIGKGSCIDRVIIDKDARIEDYVTLKGKTQSPIVIKKGTIQGALMNS